MNNPENVSDTSCPLSMHAHSTLKYIIKVENRTVHCTPCQTGQTGGGEVVREERQRGLDRFRALAPRSPARLARSNDPHPVQCNGIVVTPFPPLSFFFFLSFSLSARYSGGSFPAADATAAAATEEEGVEKTLCSRGRCSRG